MRPVEIAITEACANAVIHADPADDYEVRIRSGGGWCLVEVVDSGGGFDAAAVPAQPAQTATCGRGLMLIRGLVDQLDVRSRRPTGTLLRLSKRLV